jgi:hypothetical protein
MAYKIKIDRSMYDIGSLLQVRAGIVYIDSFPLLLEGSHQGTPLDSTLRIAKAIISDKRDFTKTPFAWMNTLDKSLNFDSIKIPLWKQNSVIRSPSYLTIPENSPASLLFKEEVYPRIQIIYPEIDEKESKARARRTLDTVSIRRFNNRGVAIHEYNDPYDGPVPFLDVFFDPNTIVASANYDISLLVEKEKSSDCLDVSINSNTGTCYFGNNRVQLPSNSDFGSIEMIDDLFPAFSIQYIKKGKLVNDKQLIESKTGITPKIRDGALTVIFPEWTRIAIANAPLESFIASISAPQ